MGGDKGRVCVTGGTGYVASWLVNSLLQHGYSVNTTVRPPPPDREKKDISYLTTLPGAGQNLSVFQADLDDPDSYAAAVEGCVGVFHVAHPIDMQDNEAEQVVTARAVNGVLGILRACLKAKTVKRVVYTSSVAAIVYNAKAAACGGGGAEELPVLDESFWSEADYIRRTMEQGGSYAISKMRTEKAAMEFAEENGLDFVSVNPPFITGPFLTPGIPGSVYVPLSLIFGNPKVYHYLLSIKMVHVDDLARAQIFLLEHPKAKGRYVVSAAQINLIDLNDYLATRYPDIYQKRDPDSLKEVKGPVAVNLSAKKLLDAGFEFKYGLDEIYDDAIRCCKEKGIL